MPIKKPKKEFGETLNSASSSTKREVNDLRNEFNSFKSKVNSFMNNSLERHDSIERKVSLLQNDVNTLNKKMDLLIDKISKQELKSDSPNSTTNFEDRLISAMSLQSKIFKEDMKNVSQNFLETLKASLEIESKSYEQKLIATFENQAKEFDKKLINAMKIRSNLAQNVSDEKNYENNTKDSNNGKEE